ncbi:MAG: hypothetical protein NTAFB09_22700 [Nitrosospira sp.]
MRQFRQRLLIDQVGSNAGEAAFAEVGKMPEYQPRNSAIQHGVSEEFKALIVRNAMAAMSQGLAEEGRLIKAVAELPA